MLTFVGIAAKRDFHFASYESSGEGILEWGPGSYRFTRVIVSPRITVPDEEAIDTARQILQRAHDTCLIANSITSAVIVKPIFAIRQ
jgi:organic hydroperoxide reductase OsmC/OhrA